MIIEMFFTASLSSSNVFQFDNLYSFAPKERRKPFSGILAGTKLKKA